MSLKITILGCGGSGGVPMIGNQWGDCDPTNPKNARSRSSVYVLDNVRNVGLLIDTSPDMQKQLLDNNINIVSAVLYTHAHADHCHGIDDLRSVNWMMKSPIDIYGDAETIETLEHKFEYIFRVKPEIERYYKPALVPHIISDAIDFDGLRVIPFEQDHRFMKTLGYRIGNFAYTTDAKSLNEDAFMVLEGVDVWVVDCVSYNEHPTHSHFAQTLEWIKRVNPKKAYLTHMGIHMDYAQLCSQLPENIRPAYDGLIIEM